MLEKLQKLLTVKSIVTISMTGTFVYLSICGKIQGTEFLTIFTTVISFYFGTQSNKTT